MVSVSEVDLDLNYIMRVKLSDLKRRADVHVR
jgi:hypothetical protein